MILEKDIERYLVSEVTKREGLCLKFPASFYEGFPDRVVILPGGKVGFCEVKKPKGGVVAPLQLRWGERLASLGVTWGIVPTKECVDAFLEQLERTIV